VLCLRVILSRWISAEGMDDDEMEDEFEAEEDDDEEMQRLGRMVGIETGEIEQAEGEDEAEGYGEGDELEDALLGEELLTNSQELNDRAKKKKRIEGVQKVRATKSESITALLVHKANLMCLLVRGIQNRCRRFIILYQPKPNLPRCSPSLTRRSCMFANPANGATTRDYKIRACRSHSSRSPKARKMRWPSLQD
jgi:hypothetical protein